MRTIHLSQILERVIIAGVGIATHTHTYTPLSPGWRMHVDQRMSSLSARPRAQVCLSQERRQEQLRGGLLAVLSCKAGWCEKQHSSLNANRQRKNNNRWAWQTSWRHSKMERLSYSRLCRYLAHHAFFHPPVWSCLHLLMQLTTEQVYMRCCNRSGVIFSIMLEKFILNPSRPIRSSVTLT